MDPNDSKANEEINFERLVFITNLVHPIKKSFSEFSPDLLTQKATMVLKLTVPVGDLYCLCYILIMLGFGVFFLLSD